MKLNLQTCVATIFSGLYFIQMVFKSDPHFLKVLRVAEVVEKVATAQRTKIAVGRIASFHS